MQEKAPALTGAFCIWLFIVNKAVSAIWHNIIDNVAESTYLYRMVASGSAMAKSERSAIGQSRVIRFKQRGASLGLTINNTSALIDQIDAGFSFDALQELESHTGISIAILASIIGIPERTLARRKAASRLAPEESERLLRISNIFEKAVELFEGDIEGAVNWLSTPKRALNNQQPLFYSRTELGGREVENLLGRLEHGVFS